MSEEKNYMSLAIKLAEKSLNPSPNPHVGAVVVKNGKIIATGFHEKAGQPHAEIIALRKAGTRANGATLVVTLEPCHHHGRTPPCTQAILKAGIDKVVIGMFDPTKAGGGAEFLRRHDIKVKTGVLKKECEDLNQIWLKNIRNNLPYLTLKLALDKDGSSIPPKGKKWITGVNSRREVMRRRAKHDSILVGANTILIDNPRLTVRGIKVGQQPTRIVLGQVTRNSKIFRQPGKVIVTKGANLKKLLTQLFKRGITSIFLEGGETTARKFLNAGLVDQVQIFQNRAGKTPPRVCGKRLPLKKTRKFGADTLFEARLKRY